MLKHSHQQELYELIIGRLRELSNAGVSLPINSEVELRATLQGIASKAIDDYCNQNHFVKHYGVVNNVRAQGGSLWFDLTVTEDAIGIINADLDKSMELN